MGHVTTEQPKRSLVPLLIVFVICFGLLAATPLIKTSFPDYLPGYLIQVPAIAIGYLYVRQFDLLHKYKSWNLRALLLLSYIVPLQNTFVLKAVRKYFLDGYVGLEILRPAIVLLLAIVLWSAIDRKRTAFPTLLAASFLTGLVGWIIASFASDHPFVSFGSGFFEFLCPFLALYVLTSNSPNRDFLHHCIKLFIIAFALIAASQTTLMLGFLCCDNVAMIPMLVDEFLSIKKIVPLMEIAGGNGYGNTDNFISLWVLVVPVVAGFYYRRGHPIWIIALFSLVYVGLLIYSRSGLLVIIVGLTALILHRLISQRTFSYLPAVAIVLLIASNLPPSGVRYMADGIDSFISSLRFALTDTDQDSLSLIEREKRRRQFDASGVDRMKAMRRGVEIASENWATGIGYGVYPLRDPELTAPHNMFLLRFAEGGFLSALSMLLLAVYSLLMDVKLFRERTTDVVAVSCAIALTCFIVKGLIFGATFSIGGQIAWGYGVALMLAVLVVHVHSHTGRNQSNTV